MRCLTIVLDATDTPKSIATLANAANNIEGFADPDARGDALGHGDIRDGSL